MATKCNICGAPTSGPQVCKACFASEMQKKAPPDDVASARKISGHPYTGEVEDKPPVHETEKQKEMRELDELIVKYHNIGWKNTEIAAEVGTTRANIGYRIVQLRKKGVLPPVTDKRALKKSDSADKKSVNAAQNEQLSAAGEVQDAKKDAPPRKRLSPEASATLEALLTVSCAPDDVEHPSHYETGQYQFIDVVEEALGPEIVKAGCLFNAFKYIYRCQHKHSTPHKDVRKANWYLNHWIEMEEKDANT